MLKGVVVAEGETERRAREFATRAELEAFRTGLLVGVNLYGAGSCGLYTADDLDEIEDGRLRHRVSDLLTGSKP